MYNRITNMNGVDAVGEYRSTVTTQSAPDGLTLTTNSQGTFYQNVYIPDRLREFLLNLRLLRQVPIAYFVPDAALLPTESVRFFNVDATWMDRIVDGVFAAANTGTVDMVLSTGVLALSRQAIDADLKSLAAELAPGTAWDPSKPMTGMLIRSELVRRWPDMIITAYETAPDDSDAAQQVAVLRAEPISKDIYIALFAGAPQMVHVREPNVGVRFGVEEYPVGTTTWTVNHRNPDGTSVAGPVLKVGVKDIPHRVISVNSLATQVGSLARMVALQLERRPYVQEFKGSISEAKGVETMRSRINANGIAIGPKLRGGRTVNLTPLQQRLAQQTQLTPKEKP